MFRKDLIAICSAVILAGSLASFAIEPGVLAGHLKIISLKTVELAKGDITKETDRNYADYPLIIRDKDGRKEVARAIAGQTGNYQVTLPPGEYVLDVQGRAAQRVRAIPHPFTVVSGQTSHIDMDVDTGIR
jgi:hypothetical protein